MLCSFGGKGEEIFRKTVIRFCIMSMKLLPYPSDKLHHHEVQEVLKDIRERTFDLERIIGVKALSICAQE